MTADSQTEEGDQLFAGIAGCWRRWVSHQGVTASRGGPDLYPLIAAGVPTFDSIRTAVITLICITPLMIR